MGLDARVGRSALLAAILAVTAAVPIASADSCGACTRSGPYSFTVCDPDHVHREGEESPPATFRARQRAEVVELAAGADPAPQVDAPPRP